MMFVLDRNAHFKKNDMVWISDRQRLFLDAICILSNKAEKLNTGIKKHLHEQ